MNIRAIDQDVVRALLEVAPQVRVRVRVEGTAVGLERVYLLPNGVICTVVQEVEDPFNPHAECPNPPPLVTFYRSHRDLSEANLLHQSLRGDWIQTNFAGADCTCADFDGADVWASNFGEAYLGGASFSGAYGVGECLFAGAHKKEEAKMVGAYLRSRHLGEQSPVVDWVWGEEEGRWSATLADGTRWSGAVRGNSARFCQVAPE